MGKVSTSFRNFGDALLGKQRVANGVMDVLGMPVRAVGRGIGAMFGLGVSTTVTVAKQPLTWALDASAGAIRATRGIIVRNPIKSGVAVAAAGGLWLMDQNNKKNAAAAEGQMAELQALQAQAAQPSYKNSASYADVQAAIDADRAAQGQTSASSHAANVVAARAQQNAPESASVTPNV